MGFNLKKTLSRAVNPVTATQDLAKQVVKPAPVHTSQPVATQAPASVATAAGNHGEAGKLAGQSNQGTKDITAGGNVKQDVASAAADGPSPGPVLNPGDKTVGGGRPGTQTSSSTNPWVNMAVPDAPTRRDFNPQTNPDGTIKTQLSAADKLGPLNYSRSDAATFKGAGSATAFNGTVTNAARGQAGDALYNRATQVGPSAWANLQTQQQKIEQDNALGNATAGSLGQQAANRTSLAAKGGVSSGSAERLAKNANQDLTLQKQAINNQGAQTRLGIGIADENTKTGLLGQSATMEQGLSQFNAGSANDMSRYNAGANQQNSQFNVQQGNQVGEYNASNTQQNNQFNTNAANTANTTAYNAKANANQFDISNALGDTQAKRNDDLSYYQEQMKNRAAGINANAIGAAGSGAGKKLGG